MIRKSLITSTLLLLVMITVLVGTSFAWFNYSLMNEGNVIQSGNLSVEFLADDAADFVGAQNLATDTSPVFTFDEFAQPGDSVVRYIKVTNKGNISLDYEIAFSINDGGLGEVIQVDIEGISPVVAQTTYTGDNLVGVTAGHLGSGMATDEFETYKMTMTYDPTTPMGAGYEGKTFEMNLIMMAWQAKYSDSRPILISTFAELEQAASVATKGSNIVINADINEPTETIAFDELVNLNFAGSTVTLNALSVTSNDYGQMTFENGTLNVDTYTINTPNAELIHEADFVVNATNSSITTSGNSYILNGSFIVNQLTLIGETKFKAQATSTLSVSGTITAPEASIAPETGATVLIKEATSTAIDTTATGALEVETAANIVAKGQSIQAALDASEGDETIYVESGIFSEVVTINKPNITLKAIGTVVIESPNDPDVAYYDINGITIKSTSDAENKYPLGTITVEGFIIRGFESGIVQSETSALLTAEDTVINILNNTIYPMERPSSKITESFSATSGYLRNGIQARKSTGLIAGNTVYTAPLAAGWGGSAITLVDTLNITVTQNSTYLYENLNSTYGIAGSGNNTGTVISNNTFEGVDYGVSFYGDAHDMNILSNTFNNVPYGMFMWAPDSNLPYNITNMIVSGNIFNASSVDNEYLGIFFGWTSISNVDFIDNVFNSISDEIIIDESVVTNDVVVNEAGTLYAVLNNEQQLKDFVSSSYTGSFTNAYLGTDIALTSQLGITRNGITIEGRNATLETDVVFGTNNSVKHTISFYSDNVTLNNVIIDAKLNSSGANLYEAQGIIFNNVTIKNSRNAALTVNGSTLTADGLYTSGNTWGAVNVDPGSGVTLPSVFTLLSGILSEQAQIWSDGRYVTETATVTVNAVGYTSQIVEGTTVWTKTN